MNSEDSAGWGPKVVLLVAFVVLLVPPGLQAQNPTALDAPANGPVEVVDVQEDGTVELVGENRVTLLFRETTESGGDTKIQKGLNNALHIRRANDDLLYTLGEGFFVLERADIRVKRLAGTGTRMLVVDQSGLFTDAPLRESFPPEGQAGGDLLGSYPAPEVKPSSVVHSLSGIQGDLELIAGDGIDIQVSGNQILVSKAPDLPQFNSGYETLVKSQSFAENFDSVLGRQPRVLEVTMNFAPGSFSRAKWVDADGDGFGTLSMVYVDHVGLAQSLVLGNTQKIGRFQTGVSDAQDFRVITAVGDEEFAIEKDSALGNPDPHLPNFFHLTWVAE